MDVVPKIRKFILREVFSEKETMISNKVKLTFTYSERDYTHEFYIVEKMAFDVILGIDFLIKYRMANELC